MPKSESESQESCVSACLGICCGCCCLSCLNVSNPWCLFKACGGKRNLDGDDDDSSDDEQSGQPVHAQPGPKATMSAA